MLEIEKIIEKVAFIDGSLRDIYIYDVNLNDWNCLIKLLKDHYILKCEEKSIPDSIYEIISIYNERAFLLNVFIGEGITANCHFYVSEEEPSPIELDLDPREFQSADEMAKVLEFMRLLGEGLNKKVFLTEENTENSVLLTYSPLDKRFLLNPQRTKT